MRDNSVRFAVSLRTGFFQAEPYILTVSLTGIKFEQVQREQSTGFFISNADIRLVYLSKGESAELEIVTNAKSYICILHKTADVSSVAQSMAALLGKKFIYTLF